MTTHSPLRRTLNIAVALLATVGVSAAFANSDAPPPTAGKQLRIGYQKYGTLTVLKTRGTLDKRLAAQGIEVKWTEFPAGPQLLEGLNVGAIDFGTTGEAPTIFALAAGAHLVYVGNQPPAPAGEAIIVPKNSPLKSVADLKGKRVAFNKGSNVHYLLVKLLEKANVPYSDIQPVNLTPADARAAFERGAIDAWVIWDPFFAAAEQQLGARVLADGTGVVNNSQYFLASKGYASARPDVLNIVLDELKKTDTWAAAHATDVATILGPQLGLEPAVVARSVSRIAYGIQPVGAEALADQQRIADTFHALKLIPRPVKVADAAWQPTTQQAAR
ncbi:Putative aliphatic sulfonates-binding protein [Ralstonia condita]|uniref:Aliphatic sulfonates-binding protein n=1 Tax=Ralstonia condita TaxID=3058600 RepID=A0ABM9J3B0_9RALS|nr:sulfonate ABC transporter substrate-binding protein [Ralstonia sp. LMG 7141]MDE2204762.1 sulfonate ABC transporter substrate-binding protein [Burkholderiaceae bacterium]CAJ0781010.1 Putative aliphatic sulfonates-binding protein [Ralstonia sp. LMG 7141]